MNDLGYDMSRAGGSGVGIDRLVMLLTDSRGMRGVIPFQLRRTRGISRFSVSENSGSGMPTFA